MMAFVHRQLNNGSREVSRGTAVKDAVVHRPNGFPNGVRKHRHDDEERGKMFVGGLSWDTSQDSLLGYFSRFGEVIDCVVMKNAETGRSRRFGFVTFSDPSVVENVLASCPHSLDGRTIDPKSCNPRSMQRPKRVAALPKVFLGGLPAGTTETDLAGFFSRYGEVCEVVIMYDQEKKKSRGFGFLSFAEEHACARAVAEHYVVIQNKKVEIKRAEPRTHNVYWNGDQKTLHWANDSSGSSQQESLPPIQILPPATNAFWGQPALQGAPAVAQAMPPPFAPPLHSQPPPATSYPPFGAPTPLAHPPPAVTPQQRGPIPTPVSASVQHWTAQPPPVWTVPTSTYATPPPTMASYGSPAAAVAPQPPPQFWPPSHQAPPPMPGHPYQGKVYQGGAAAYTSPPTPVTSFSSAVSVYPYQQHQLCTPTVQVLNPVPVMAVPQHQPPSAAAAKTPYADCQEGYGPQQHMVSTSVQVNGGSGGQRMAVYAQPSSQVQSYHPYRRS